MTRGRREVRIAWIIGRLNVGGPAVFLLDALPALRPLGYHSIVLAGPSEPAEGDLAGEAQARGIEVVRIPDMRRAVDPSADARAALHILKVLREVCPDIVQTQTAKAGALGRLAARLARVPVVVHTFHGHVFAEYFGPTASRAIVAAERGLARLCDAVGALSPLQARELSERYRIAPEVRVLPIGIELGPFLGAEAHRGELRAELGLPPVLPIVTYVGRLIAVKELPRLIEAASALRSAGKPVALIVAGDGDRRPALESLARGEAHFLGWRRDLPRIYADADVVACTSRDEGTPVSIMEAMASGRAVVATRVGGVPDLIDHERTGWLVPSGDGKALVRALGELTSDPERRRALGSAAREAAVARFDVASAARTLDHCYRELLIRKGFLF
jgi:glycosyltransferase involved in cell wall biosynthesis